MIYFNIYFSIFLY